MIPQEEMQKEEVWCLNRTFEMVDQPTTESALCTLTKMKHFAHFEMSPMESSEQVAREFLAMVSNFRQDIFGKIE